MSVMWCPVRKSYKEETGLGGGIFYDRETHFLNAFCQVVMNFSVFNRNFSTNRTSTVAPLLLFCLLLAVQKKI